jgi:hypothetical protein
VREHTVMDSSRKMRSSLGVGQRRILKRLEVDIQEPGYEFVIVNH